MAVRGCLEYCAFKGISVSVPSARAYMDDVERRGLARQPDLWKDGLNWYFQSAAGAHLRGGAPNHLRNERSFRPDVLQQGGQGVPSPLDDLRQQPSINSVRATGETLGGRGG